MNNFSKILFVCIAVSAISLSSCTKEKNALVGTWTLENSNLEYGSTNPIYTAMLNQYGSDVSDIIQLPEVLIFNADGTGTYDGNKPFTYTKTDSKITFVGISTGVIGMEDSFSVDYQILDKKTLKMKMDVKEIAMPFLRMIINNNIDELLELLELLTGQQVEIEDVINSITKIDFLATYKKI